MRVTRIAQVTLAIAAVGLLCPLVAFGAATVTPISEQFVMGPAPVDDTCAGAGVVGILTGTGSVRGRLVENGDRGHLNETTRTQWRVDFADGTYLLESQREGFVFNFIAEPQYTLGGTTLAKGTLYSPDGSVIGHETVHASFRLTVVDSEVVVDFHRFRLGCR